MTVLEHPFLWNLIALALIILALIPVGMLLYGLGRFGLLCLDHWCNRESHENEERQMKEEADAWLREIRTLPVEAARVRVQRLLRDPNRFVTEPNPDSTRPELKELAPLQREVFAAFQTIATPCGSVRLSLLEFGPVLGHGSRRIPSEASYSLIGGSEDTRYMIRRCEELIYCD